jgi:two-component system, NarL family, nitrate/nitrite response regulator NarL
MTSIRLLLVDDHILFREGIGRLLASEPDFEVVTECGMVSDARAIVEQRSIDVVLLDFDLGGADGLELISKFREAGWKGRVLMVTAGMTPEESSLALRLGASGIFLKNNSPGALAQAIRMVAAGGTWIDQTVVQLIAESVMPHDDPGEDELLTERERQILTKRERQVLHGVFEGLANKEIGALIGVSVSAVKTTMQQLFHKTGVRTRGQLVRIALERSYAPTWKAHIREEHPVSLMWPSGRKMNESRPKDVLSA